MTTRSDTRARAPVADRDDADLRPNDEVYDRDALYAAPARTLQWGPIVAGLVITLTTFLMLSLLAAGLGLAVVNADGGTPTAVATVVTSIIALVAFFLGGFVAAWGGRASNGARGALYGFLVFSTWMIVVLVLSGMGLSSLFGEIGAVMGNIQAPELSQQEILDALSTGAIGAFLALALAGLAAALGGAVGASDRVYARR